MQGVAGELVGIEGAGPAVPPSGQASGAAVSAARALVESAGAMLAARTQATGTIASVAAATYLDTEEASAARLGALSSPVLVV